MSEKLNMNEFDNEHEWEEDEGVAGHDSKTVEDYLGVTTKDFKVVQKELKISDIIYNQTHKDARYSTVSGLTKSVETLGVLNPIHVVETEREGTYLLLNGLRRIYGSIKAGRTEIPALVVTFDDVSHGKEISLLLGRVLDDVQRHTWAEIWDLVQVYEKQGITAPAVIEGVLGLQSGDVMKLKDVMLCKYQDIVDAMLSGEYDLRKGLSELNKRRKAEDALAEAETSGVGGVESMSAEDARLSDDEVREMLDMESSIADLDDEDFAEVTTVDDLVTYQTTDDRRPLDPLIKEAALKRENFKCECCGIGGPAFLGTLIAHHKIPVHAGGPDSVDNIAILCDTDHIMVHIVERSKGVLPISKEDFNAYDKDYKDRLQKINRFGKLAYEAGKRKGKSDKEIRSDAHKSTQRRMPGAGLSENKAAFYSEDNKK